MFFCRSEREVLRVLLLFFCNIFFALSCLHALRVGRCCCVGLRKAEGEYKQISLADEKANTEMLNLQTQTQILCVQSEVPEWNQGDPVLSTEVKQVKADVSSTAQEAAWWEIWVHTWLQWTNRDFHTYKRTFWHMRRRSVGSNHNQQLVNLHPINFLTQLIFVERRDTHWTSLSQVWQGPKNHSHLQVN